MFVLFPVVLREINNRRSFRDRFCEQNTKPPVPKSVSPYILGRACGTEFATELIRPQLNNQPVIISKPSLVILHVTVLVTSSITCFVIITEVNTKFIYQPVDQLLLSLYCLITLMGSFKSNTIIAIRVLLGLHCLAI